MAMMPPRVAVMPPVVAMMPPVVAMMPPVVAMMSPVVAMVLSFLDPDRVQILRADVGGVGCGPGRGVHCGSGVCRRRGKPGGGYEPAEEAK